MIFDRSTCAGILLLRERGFSWTRIGDEAGMAASEMEVAYVRSLEAHAAADEARLVASVANRRHLLTPVST